VARTYSGMSFFASAHTRTVMENVLLTWSLEQHRVSHLEQIAYSQGMHELLAVIMWALNNDILHAKRTGELPASSEPSPRSSAGHSPAASTRTLNENEQGSETQHAQDLGALGTSNSATSGTTPTSGSSASATAPVAIPADNAADSSSSSSVHIGTSMVIDSTKDWPPLDFNLRRRISLEFAQSQPASFDERRRDISRSRFYSYDELEDEQNEGSSSNDDLSDDDIEIAQNQPDNTENTENTTAAEEKTDSIIAHAPNHTTATPAPSPQTALPESPSTEANPACVLSSPLPSNAPKRGSVISPALLSPDLSSLLGTSPTSPMVHTVPRHRFVSLPQKTCTRKKN
jgi:hypothetical protein